jgi:hypothetical protein
LLRKKMVVEGRDEHRDYDGFTVTYAMTEVGLEWLMSNETRLIMRHDDIPF